MSMKSGLGVPLAALLAGSLLSTGAAAVSPRSSLQAASSRQEPRVVAAVTDTTTATVTTQPTATSTATATATAATQPTATATATLQPTATSTATPTATSTSTPRPTSTPVVAILSVSPATTTPGGVIVVNAGNFGSREAVTITLTGARSTLATLRADPQGRLVNASVTLPYSAASGAQTLTATGASTRRTVSTTLTVNAVVATLAVSPATTNRGGLITISGGNFAPREKLTITLDGVSASLATITATAGGGLPLTGVSIPYTLPEGTHTLRVSGAVSGRTVTTPIVIAALTPTISLSVSTVRPGGAITVTGRSFGRQERVTLALNGAALVTTPSVITTTNSTFTASFAVPASILRGPNTISAIGNQSRVSAVTTVMGTLPVASTFYFAGASTMAGETATIPILNPNAQSVHVDLTIYFTSGPPGAVGLDVPAHSRGTADLNKLVGAGKAFGVQMTADRVVQAQLREQRAGRDEFSLLGVSAPSTTWYLAEGYTGLTFHEAVSILNPLSTSTVVRLRLLPFGGRPGRTIGVTIAAQSAQTIDINKLLPGQSLSVIADSNTPIVVERTLTFSSNGFGITGQPGINTAATSWIFAEGTTTTRFQTYLTILNPSAAPITVTASFYSTTGTPLGSITQAVSGLSRANVKLNDLTFNGAPLRASGIATIVTSNAPVVVERPEYFGSPNGAFVAGSDVFGRNGAGLSWAFPGGTTTDRSEFLLVYNPSARTATINATFYALDGTVKTQTFSVAPTVRYNVDINRLMPFIPGITPEHSIVLSSTNGVGFVAEQTVFSPNFSTLDSTQGFAQ